MQNPQLTNSSIFGKMKLYKRCANIWLKEVKETKKMLKAKIIETLLSADKEIIYRAVRTSADSFELEIEYKKNNSNQKKYISSVTDSSEEIIKMNRIFAEELVFPEVFEETAADYAEANHLNHNKMTSRHLTVIEEIGILEDKFIYRTVKTDNEKYGLEFEYIENGETHRITAAELSDDESEIIKMNRLFAEEIVFPNVFEETAEDYLKSIDLQKI